MDVYRVAVAISLTSNHAGVLGALSSQLLHVHGHIGKIEQGWNRVKVAMAGGISLAGGVGLLKVAGHIESAGEKLVHAQTVFAAGLPAHERAAASAKATAAAWAEAAKNMNTSVIGNVEAIHDIYNVVQDIPHALDLLPSFNKLQAALGLIKDGASIGEAASSKNVASAVRAFELMGKTDPHALEEMTKDFTRTTIALRGRVDGQNFLTAVQGAGDARYGWNEQFASQGFPALVNAMGTKAGNLMNMLNNNLYGGVSSSQIQAGYQIQYGLHEAGDLEANKKAFKPGTVFEAAKLRSNPLEWANDYRELLRSMGFNVDDLKTMQDIVARVGRGNRSVKAALDELLLPMTNRQLNKEVGNIGRVGKDAFDVLSENDPKLLRDAFHKQLGNLLTALGSPMVKPAMEMLKQLTQVVGELAQTASKNPDVVLQFAQGFVALGASLTAGGAVALLAAIGPAGWLAAGLTALIALDFKGAEQQWEMVKRDAKLVTDFFTWVGGEAEKISKALEPYLSFFGLGKDPSVRMSEGAREGIEARKNSGDPMGRLVTSLFGGIESMLKSIAPLAAQWEEFKTKTYASIADLVPKLVAEIKSWPNKLTEAITSMGADLVKAIGDKLKGLFSNPGNVPAIGLPMSYEGAGGIGALIHQASLGGANDNVSGVARALGRGGLGAGGGGSVAVPGGVSMSAEERNKLWLIQKYESGGRNVPNYRFDPGHTAQCYYQITNSNWRRIAPRLGISAPNASSASLEDQTKVALHMLRAGRGSLSDWAPFNPSLRRAIGRGERAPNGGAPPTAGPPPRQREEVHVHNVYMDGERIERHVTRRMVAKARFPTSVGGPDTHGSWHGPGTAGTKVA